MAKEMEKVGASAPDLGVAGPSPQVDSKAPRVRVGPKEREVLKEIARRGGKVRKYSEGGKVFPYFHASRYESYAEYRIWNMIKKGLLEQKQEINPETKRKVFYLYLTEKAKQILAS